MKFLQNSTVRPPHPRSVGYSLAPSGPASPFLLLFSSLLYQAAFCSPAVVLITRFSTTAPTHPLLREWKDILRMDFFLSSRDPPPQDCSYLCQIIEGLCNTHLFFSWLRSSTPLLMLNKSHFGSSRDGKALSIAIGSSGDGAVGRIRCLWFLDHLLLINRWGNWSNEQSRGIRSGSNSAVATMNRTTF